MTVGIGPPEANDVEFPIDRGIRDAGLATRAKRLGAADAMELGQLT